MKRHEENLEQKIKQAKHVSKPNDPNTVVLYDKTGRWVCEIYTAGHVIKDNRENIRA